MDETARLETLRERVRAERAVRMLSIRQASNAGGISNTSWSSFENGKTGLTVRMRYAVAKAFGWDDDWPFTQPPTLRLVSSAVTLEEVDAKVDAVLRLVEQLALDVAEIAAHADLQDLQ